MARITYPADEVDEDVHVDLDATPARQGMRGVHILWVLAISLMLAAAALFGSWAFRSQDLARVQPNNRAAPAEAQKFDGPTAGVRQNYDR
jgi:hypothetical protein